MSKCIIAILSALIMTQMSLELRKHFSSLMVSGFSLGLASSCFIQLKIPRLLRLQFFEGYTIFCNTIFHEQTSIMFLLLEIRIRGGYKSLSHWCSFTFIIYLLLTSLHRILRPNTVINHNWIC